MKKVISLLLVLCFFVSAFSFGAYAKYAGDILFNDIPWGTDYYETIRQLKEKYDIEFDEPKYREEEVSLSKVVGGERYEFKSSAVVSVSVKSKNTVKIANYPAQVFLVFYFLNDGTEIFENDLHKTALSYAEYTFLNLQDRDTTRKELMIKLESIYGGYESTGTSKSFYYYGKDPKSTSDDVYDTQLSISNTESGDYDKTQPHDGLILTYKVYHNYWREANEAVLNQKVNNAYETMKNLDDAARKQFEEDARNGNKDGL